MITIKWGTMLSLTNLRCPRPSRGIETGRKSNRPERKKRETAALGDRLGRSTSPLFFQTGRAAGLRDRRGWRLGLVIGLTVLALLPRTGRGAILEAQFANLPDAISGRDLWEGVYRVSDASFLTGQGFTLYFAHDEYSEISEALPPVSDDWDRLTVQPDTGLPDDGFFDALALVDSPSLSDPFRLEFVWGGSGTPGAQPFETYDSSNGFAVLESGSTSVVIPEPAQVTLATGLLALGFTAFRRFRAKRSMTVREGAAR